MAYMRGEWYVYSDGENINIVGPSLVVSVPIDVWDSLVMMRYHQLRQDGRISEVERRTIDQHHGNIGCDALAKAYGLPTVMEQVATEVELEAWREQEGPDE